MIFTGDHPMRAPIILMASLIAAGSPASAQTGQGCMPHCVAEAPSGRDRGGGIDDRLNLDTGSFIRARDIEDAGIRAAAEDAFGSGGGVIPFAIGESGPGEGARARLDKVIAWLKVHPEAKVRLEGHADDPASDEYNLALGDRRANSVRTYMVDRGIEPSRLSTVTFGRSRPLSPGGGRVEIVLGKEGGR